MIYERTGQSSSLSRADIAEPVLRNFALTDRAINRRSLIAWAEHCTECAMPDCYKSCAFYRPRGDLKCRRFENGFQTVNAARSPDLVEIAFGKWAQLEGIGPTALLGRAAFKTLERTDALLSWATRHLPMPYYIRARFERLYGVLQATAGRLDVFARPLTRNTSFLAEVHNPTSQPVKFRFSFGQSGEAPAFMTVLTFQPGYNAVLVPAAEIFGTAPIPSSIQI
ncbi:MAG: hypothetical protein ACR2RE_07275, partial [Geminicoccaceae bacterium]